MPYLSFKLIIPIILLSVPAIADKNNKIEWERFNFEGNDAFIILPAKDLKSDIPWVLYAPTLRGLPNERDEGWMINHFLKAESQ